MGGEGRRNESEQKWIDAGWDEKIPIPMHESDYLQNLKNFSTFPKEVKDLFCEYFENPNHIYSLYQSLQNNPDFSRKHMIELLSYMNECFKVIDLYRIKFLKPHELAELAKIYYEATNQEEYSRFDDISEKYQSIIKEQIQRKSLKPLKTLTFGNISRYLCENKNQRFESTLHYYNAETVTLVDLIIVLNNVKDFELDVMIEQIIAAQRYDELFSEANIAYHRSLYALDDTENPIDTIIRPYLHMLEAKKLAINFLNSSWELFKEGDEQKKFDTCKKVYQYITAFYSQRNTECENIFSHMISQIVEYPHAHVKLLSILSEAHQTNLELAGCEFSIYTQIVWDALKKSLDTCEQDTFSLELFKNVNDIKERQIQSVLFKHILNHPDVVNIAERVLVYFIDLNVSNRTAISLLHKILLEKERFDHQSFLGECVNVIGESVSVFCTNSNEYYCVKYMSWMTKVFPEFIDYHTCSRILLPVLEEISFKENTKLLDYTWLESNINLSPEFRSFMLNLACTLAEKEADAFECFIRTLYFCVEYYNNSYDEISEKGFLSFNQIIEKIIKSLIFEIENSKDDLTWTCHLAELENHILMHNSRVDFDFLAFIKNNIYADAQSMTRPPEQYLSAVEYSNDQNSLFQHFLQIVKNQ